MFEGIIEHIKFNYPRAVFSELFYVAAVPNAIATMAIADVNHANEKARAIFMQFIYLETVAAPMTLVDQYNNPLFVTPTNGNGWLPIGKITKGAQLRVTNTSGKQIFWISYQYILDAK